MSPFLMFLLLLLFLFLSSNFFLFVMIIQFVGTLETQSTLDKGILLFSSFHITKIYFPCSQFFPLFTFFICTDKLTFSSHHLFFNSPSHTKLVFFVPEHNSHLMSKEPSKLFPMKRNSQKLKMKLWNTMAMEQKVNDDCNQENKGYMSTWWLLSITAELTHVTAGT